MARIRTVKPELFRHEGLQNLESNHLGSFPILVFIALLGHADANGVFPWQPRQLKLDVLPFLSFDMAETLEILRTAGFIERYEVDGKVYGLIPTFRKHQRLSGKEAANGERYPIPNQGSNGEAPEKQLGSRGEILESQELGSRNLGLGSRKEEHVKEGGPGGGKPENLFSSFRENHNTENRKSKDQPPSYDDVYATEDGVLISVQTSDEGCFMITQSQAFALREEYPYVPNVTDVLIETNGYLELPTRKFKTKMEVEAEVRKRLEWDNDVNRPARVKR